MRMRHAAAVAALIAGLCRAQPAPVEEQAITDEVVQKVDPSVVAIQHEHAGGSGFVVTPDGYILSNGHVVKGDDEEDPTQTAKSITVILHDERKYPARVIGFSTDPDVALLKIEPDHALHPVEFAAPRSAHIGQRCFAVGTPIGLKRTFTSGILSNVERTDLDTETRVLQTDAAINPGNSGGPLFDSNGRVLGINTYATQGNNLGFTIPIDVALVLKEHFLAHGRFVRAVTPLFIFSEIYDELARTLGVDKGVLITFVMPGSPAFEAGMRDGDVLVAVDGVPCSAHRRAELLDLDWSIMTRPVGGEITYTVLRGSGAAREQHVIKARLEAMELLPKMGYQSGEIVEHRYDALGLGIRQVGRISRLLMRLSDDPGVLIATAAPSSAAGRAGLRQGDLVTAVEGEPTPTVEAFRHSLESRLTQRSKMIELRVARGKMSFPTALKPYYSLKNRTVALVVPPRDPEYVDLLRRELLASGANVVLASPSGLPVKLEAGTLKMDRRLAALSASDFAILVFAGGAGGRDLWKNKDALRLAKEAYGAEKIVGAVGPSAMVLVNGVPGLKQKITVAKEDSAEATAKKANYTGSDVESDGRVVTTTGFDRETVRDFLKALYRVERDME